MPASPPLPLVQKKHRGLGWRVMMEAANFFFFHATDVPDRKEPYGSTLLFAVRSKDLRLHCTVI